MDKDTAQLLAWYVNGSLAGPDRDRVEDALRDDPAAESHIGWERAVRSAMKDDPLFDVPADRGLSQVMQKIRSEAPAEEAKPKAIARKAPPVRARAPSGTGWLARLRDSLSMSPALGLACALVVAQFAVINYMWVSRSGSEEADYSGVRAVEQRAADSFIRVTFKPDSTEAQMSALLRANHAEIVAGPSQLGDYYVLVGRGDAPGALEQFQAAKHVESAEIVNALPSRQ